MSFLRLGRRGEFPGFKIWDDVVLRGGRIPPKLIFNRKPWKLNHVCIETTEQLLHGVCVGDGRSLNETFPRSATGKYGIIEFM